MAKKFDLGKIVGSKWFGIGSAAIVALGAFMTERENQAKEKTIKDLVKRVSDLEQK